jgi:hypothetical protein
MAKKGDVLIWHADLMHGGTPIQDSRQTRKSLVARVLPLGVMATFYDFTKVTAMPYPGISAYCFDTRNLTVGEDHSDNGTPSGSMQLWRRWVPLSVRPMISPSFAAWARRHIPR